MHIDTCIKRFNEILTIILSKVQPHLAVNKKKTQRHVHHLSNVYNSATCNTLSANHNLKEWMLMYLNIDYLIDLLIKGQGYTIIISKWT